MRYSNYIFSHAIGRGNTIYVCGTCTIQLLHRFVPCCTAFSPVDIPVAWPGRKDLSFFCENYSRYMDGTTRPQDVGTCGNLPTRVAALGTFIRTNMLNAPNRSHGAEIWRQIERPLTFFCQDFLESAAAELNNPILDHPLPPTRNAELMIARQFCERLHEDTRASLGIQDPNHARAITCVIETARSNLHFLGRKKKYDRSSFIGTFMAMVTPASEGVGRAKRFGLHTAIASVLGCRRKWVLDASRTGCKRCVCKQYTLSYSWA
jgi:hypothetical protein